MRRAWPVLLLAGLAPGLAACESSQDRSARLAASATGGARQKGLSVARVNPDVQVRATSLLHDAAADRTAAVVTLRNTSSRPLQGVPVLITLRGAAGRKVFSNDTPGLSTDLTTVSLLAPGRELSWVDDQIVGVQGARTLQARVGTAARAATVGADALPRMRVSKVRLKRDPVDGLTAEGRVVNTSQITQQRLVVYAVARRGTEVVAAGRAIVPLLKPGPKGAPFTAFFVGDPRRGKLEFTAPPVVLEQRR